jgi:hypothetical protein
MRGISWLAAKTGQLLKKDCAVWSNSRAIGILDLHFLSVNEKTTHAVILQCSDTRRSPTCFCTLKCTHHQGINHDPAEIGAQCYRNQRWVDAVYCSRYIASTLH